MSEEAKKALETAVAKVGKALGELLKVAEKNGDDISTDDYAKARYFLEETNRKVWEKIDVVRDIAKATSGSFSLDSVELPEMVTVPHYSIVPLPLPPIIPGAPLEFQDGKVLAQQIGGRLTKAAKADLARSVNTELPRPSSDDDDDDIDFIDD